MNTRSRANEVEAEYFWFSWQRAPWGATKEKRWNMNKCILPAALASPPPPVKREKNARRRARIEKNDVSGRVYTSTRGRRIKLCRSFPGENTRRAASPSIQCRQFPTRRFGLQLAEKCSCKKRSLRLREKAPLYPPAYSDHEFWWILFSPAELSAGTTLICIMQFTCAIYTRAPAQFLDIRVVGRALAERIPFRSVCAPLSLSFFLFTFYSLHLAIRGFSRAIYLSTYNAIVRVASTSCFKLK